MAQILAQLKQKSIERSTPESFASLWSPELLSQLRQAYILTEDQDLFKLVYMGEQILFGSDADAERFYLKGPTSLNDLSKDNLVQNGLPHRARNRMALLNAILVHLRFVLTQESEYLQPTDRLYKATMLDGYRADASYLSLLLQVPEFTFFSVVPTPTNSFAQLAHALWPLVLKLNQLVPTFDESIAHSTADIAVIKRLRHKISRTIATSHYFAEMQTSDGPFLSSKNCAEQLLKIK